MYRVSILKKDGNLLSKNFKDKESADNFALQYIDTSKKIIIKNKDTKEREIIQ